MLRPHRSVTLDGIRGYVTSVRVSAVRGPWMLPCEEGYFHFVKNLVANFVVSGTGCQSCRTRVWRPKVGLPLLRNRLSDYLE